MLKVFLKKKMEGFDFSVQFETSENRVGILGASGEGKSMTLRMLAGIEEPDEGYIELDGKVLLDTKRKIKLPPQKRHVGYLFQNYALFPNMTVEKNIESGMEKSSLKKEKVKKLLETFSLDGLEKRYPRELSGGQQQRVALARILASNPAAILLDEPFSALDVSLKERLLQELLQYVKEYKGFVCMVSHNQDEIYSFSKELFILNGGHIVEQGETRQIFETPKRVETAGLVGVDNISRIKWIDNNTVYALDWGVNLKVNAQENQNANYVGIRGEDIEYAHEQAEIQVLDTILQGTMELPTRKHALMRSGKQGAEPIVVKRVKGTGNLSDSINEHVRIFFPQEKLLLLAGEITA